MFYTKGLRGVKIYCGDELIGESPVCYSNEPVPIKIPQNDMTRHTTIIITRPLFVSGNSIAKNPKNTKVKIKAIQKVALVNISLPLSFRKIPTIFRP